MELFMHSAKSRKFIERRASSTSGAKYIYSEITFILQYFIIIIYDCVRATHVSECVAPTIVFVWIGRNYCIGIG